MHERQENWLEAGDVEKEQYLKTVSIDPLDVPYVETGTPENVFLERVKYKEECLKRLERTIPRYMLEKWQAEIENGNSF